MDSPLAPPLKAFETDFVDYVFISHDHLDHADPETIAGIISANPNVKFVCGSAIADNISGYGVKNLTPLDNNSSVVCTEFSVRIIPAAHEEIHFDENGNPAECGFVFDFGGLHLYHSGDSLVYDGLCDEVRDTDIMLLPVNGNGFFRRADDIMGNMDTFDAARHC